MKSQDILILLKLISLQQQARVGMFNKENITPYPGIWNPHLKPIELPSPETSEAYTARGLEAALGISKTEINISIKRSINAGLAKRDRKTLLPTTHVTAFLEFIFHGIKYVFPVRAAELVRGVPTACYAPMLQDEILSAGAHKMVWPDANALVMGQSVVPLYKSAPFAVRQDRLLYEYLALIDAIRLGGSREAAMAKKRLEAKLKA